MRKIILFLFSIVVISSCGKEGVDPIDNPTNPLLAETKLNVNYGSSTMDVYLPANRNASTTKVIFLIHGGAWASGDKNDFAAVVDTLKKRLPDYAIINVNYRLSNGIANNFPTQENDINTAINYVYGKRSEYVISDKWVYIGASAGGHLAMLQGYKHQTTIKPKAIVNYFGPSDLVLLYNGTDASSQLGLWALLGGTPSTAPTKYFESSPINYITNLTPPTITLQGVSDNTVPQAQQLALHAKLKTNNVPELLEIYKDEGHGFTAPTMTKSFDLVVQFLNTHVK